MIKKLNKKGFTLVELLATIAVLGLLGAVTFVASTKYYEISKRKAEESFKKQLKGYVDDYLALYGSSDFEYEIADGYGNNGVVQKCYKDGSDTKCSDTTLFKATTDLNFNDVIDEVVNSPEVKNPSTQIGCNTGNLTINVYRDSDYVYCFTINPNEPVEFSCINSKINSCEGIYKHNNSNITLE